METITFSVPQSTFHVTTAFGSKLAELHALLLSKNIGYSATNRITADFEAMILLNEAAMLCGTFSDNPLLENAAEAFLVASRMSQTG